MVYGKKVLIINNGYTRGQRPKSKFFLKFFIHFLDCSVKEKLKPLEISLSIALSFGFYPIVQDDGVIHKELCFSSSSGRPNLKGQVCKLASRNGNFFPRLIFCSLKQKVAALLHFTVPLCFCVEVVGATIIYKS